MSSELEVRRLRRAGRHEEATRLRIRLGLRSPLCQAPHPNLGAGLIRCTREYGHATFHRFKDWVASISWMPDPDAPGAPP